jgi:hypothetical protein
MTVQIKPKVDDPTVGAKTVSINDQVPSLTSAKESEPQRAQEAKLLGEIKEKSKELDLDAEKKISDAISGEVILRDKDIEIPPDLEAHGIKSPAAEASKVITHGSTLELPISEEQYKTDEKTKVDGVVSNNSILGVKSLAGLVIFIGRIIKLGHHRMKKVIFRKPSSKKATEGHGGLGAD